MKYASLILVFFLSCKTKTPPPAAPIPAPEGFHLMIKTGLPEIEATNQLNFSAKKYHVKFYNIGCVTDRYTIDSINKINDSVSLIVQSQFGNNWLRNLRLELDTIHKVNEIAFEEILKRNISHSESFYFLTSAGLRKNEYLVKAYSIVYKNDEPQITVQYNLGIDYKKKLLFEISRASAQEKITADNISN